MRTTMLAAALLAAATSCQQPNPPTTPLAVPIRPPATQSDEHAALAAAVKENLAKLQRQ